MWGRDVNAARNILIVLCCMLLGLPRPSYLRRQGAPLREQLQHEAELEEELLQQLLAEQEEEEEEQLQQQLQQLQQQQPFEEDA